MANLCFNSLTITSATDAVQPLLKMLTDSRTTDPTAEYGDYWYSAFIGWMRTNGGHPDPSLGAAETDFSVNEKDGKTKIHVTWSSRWTYDEDFIRCLGAMRGLERVEFYAEEPGCIVYAWEVYEDGALVSSRVGEEGWYLESDESTAVRWNDGSWTIGDEESSAEEVLTKLASSDDEDLRLTAAEHDDTPLSVIISLIGDEYEEADDAARDALCRFTNEELAVACGVPGVDLSDVPTNWLVETIKAMS